MCRCAEAGPCAPRSALRWGAWWEERSRRGASAPRLSRPLLRTASGPWRGSRLVPTPAGRNGVVCACYTSMQRPRASLRLDIAPWAACWSLLAGTRAPGRERQAGRNGTVGRKGRGLEVGCVWGSVERRPGDVNWECGRQDRNTELTLNRPFFASLLVRAGSSWACRKFWPGPSAAGTPWRMYVYMTMGLVSAGYGSPT